MHRQQNIHYQAKLKQQLAMGNIKKVYLGMNDTKNYFCALKASWVKR